MAPTTDSIREAPDSWARCLKPLPRLLSVVLQRSNVRDRTRQSFCLDRSAKPRRSNGSPDEEGDGLAPHSLHAQGVEDCALDPAVSFRYRDSAVKATLLPVTGPCASAARAGAPTASGLLFVPAGGSVAAGHASGIPRQQRRSTHQRLREAIGSAPAEVGPRPLPEIDRASGATSWCAYDAPYETARPPL